MSTARLEDCIAEISHWMFANRLKVNIDKTEWLLASSRQALSLLGDIHPELKLETTTIAVLDSVRLLGVWSQCRSTRFESPGTVHASTDFVN